MTQHPDLAANLARWQAEEEAVRARLTQPGVPHAAMTEGKTGLQFMEAVIAGELPWVPAGETMNFWPVEVAIGRVVLQGQASASYLNPMGTVHGGWTAALLDTAVGCAVHTTLPAGKAYTTAELKISYVRAITLQTGPVRVEALVLNAGSRLGFAEGRVTGADGKLYAHATTTCLIFEQASLTHRSAVLPPSLAGTAPASS